jgi:hypothetical protein
MRVCECQPGDRVFGESVFFDNTGARVFINPVEIIAPEHGIVRAPAGVRVACYSESFHADESLAREAAAAKIRQHAADLARQADDLAEPRVVTV